MTREELLAALLVERYDNRWWTAKPALVAIDERDNEIACARRRRELVQAWDEHTKEATA